MKGVDLTGKRFGRLIVKQFIGKNKYGHLQWLCKCDCGNEKIVTSGHLTTGDVKSCGCYCIELAKNKNYKHGKTDTKLFSVWQNIIRRCEKSTSKSYKNYGGRGITICKEWRDSFQAFYDWAMANGYSDDLTIDRINNDGNYCPENCRWATVKEQANNRRSNSWYNVNGETLTLSQIADKYNVKYPLLVRRVTDLRWSVEKAIKTPIRKCNRRENNEV